MATLRKPFLGVFNIVRFNWHYYVLSFVFVTIILLIRYNFNAPLSVAANVLVLLIIVSTIISLVVSSYIYDFSDLYKLSWLDSLKQNNKERIINITAGFDETSYLLKSKYSNAELIVADFYDPFKHTEVSIKRARKAYSAYPDTKQVATNHLPLQDNCADKIFTILSAHEIRNEDERITFFKELRRILASTGIIIVTEHLRDAPDFLAYNIGFFHFHSKATWLMTFSSAGLILSNEMKITPFIRAFILKKNGTTS